MWERFKKGTGRMVWVSDGEESPVDGARTSVPALDESGVVAEIVRAFAGNEEALDVVARACRRVAERGH